ncbi:MAG: HAMP domain-containing histidine kinase [Defluviitaleaceae bacterium]|nr:HAMP domain-containing histidine kinase [Defluviitaleaceae bacterium]
MRLKTFIAAYMLFLGILFISIGIVSTHMANSTTYMLREKAAREFQTITTSLAREIAAVYSRFPGGYGTREPVGEIFSRFLHYYGQHGIDLGLTQSIYENPAYATVSFQPVGDEHFIFIYGTLPNPFRFYSLSYRLNVTANITDMQGIQQYLWVTSIIVSLVAAVLLYVILLKIFKPLEVVAVAAEKITEGQYGQQITVTGRNELAAVAVAFNRMSAQIEAQIQELEEENERKQQFVDNFAHEIRTPLTSIFGYAEYLQKASLREGELLESAEYIMSEANHMKNVANSLLELATLRDYQPEKTQIFIPELFIEIKQSLEKTLEERGIELRIQALAPYIDGQPDLIKALLLNLCANAISSCEQGKGIVRLSASIEKDNIIISIDDNGCGIPSDKLSKVTEPFFRIDKARSRNNQGGAGLGLALCKQIAHVHEAKMTIASTQGIGTLVRLTFTPPK